jgi:hypothetical protein
MGFRPRPNPRQTASKRGAPILGPENAIGKVTLSEPKIMSRALLSFVLVSLVAGCSESSTGPRRSFSPADGPATFGKVTQTTTPVTSTIFDADALGNLFDTRSDHYNGTGQATYVTTGTSAKGYTSEIGVNGAWRLFLGNQTLRTVYLVLGSQGVKSQTGATIPDGYYSTNLEMYSQCYDASGTQLTLPGMALGSENDNCSFGVDFGASGTVYKLVMGPQFAGTGRASVTCTAASASACTAWSIVPNTSAPNVGVAQLNYYTRSGALVPLASYHNSFRITVTQ